MEKINIKTVILVITFFASMFSLLFLNWINNSDISSKVNFICVLALILLFHKEVKICKKDIILLFLLLIYVLVNFIFTGEHEYFFNYFVNQTLFPFLSVIVAISLSKDSVKLKKYILNPSFVIINIYYFINLFVILKQIENPSFMLRNFTNNTFYMDHIDGFFGGNGTHKLAFFQLFCLFLNSIFFSDQNVRKRKISKILFVLIFITSCYVSIYNDNRMYFFLILIFFLPLIRNINFVDFKNKNIVFNRESVFKFIIVVISIILVSSTLYYVNDNFRNFIREELYEQYIERTIDKVNGSLNDETGSSEERIELLKFSIEEGGLIGKGIGSVSTGSVNNIKKHLALNDVNIRIYTGGIIFALLVIWIYSYYYSTLFLNKSLLMRFYLFVTVLVSAIYFQPFTYSVQTMIFSNVYLLMSVKLNEKNIKE